MPELFHLPDSECSEETLSDSDDKDPENSSEDEVEELPLQSRLSWSPQKTPVDLVASPGTPISSTTQASSGADFYMRQKALSVRAAL
jgi:hypothetical protein